MTTERIDIEIRENGSRVVHRNLDEIANSADRISRSVTLMKRTLQGIGVTALVRGTFGLVEEYQKLQNRLGAVGLEGSKLTSVYNKLLTAANDTRSSVKGTVELYSRLALSTRDLGVNQEQLIGFTKSVNQAILLSGASAKEAENGLIQLSQGMASNRLSGDELRSVLEQLPIVADVIAKRMGVTRGELRKLGAQGKITADVILNAFKDAGKELDERFKHLTPTISQAFVTLKNNTITAVGELATATGIIPGVANAIKFLADNVKLLIEGLWNLAKVLTVVGTAYLAMQASLKVGAIVSAVQAWLDLKSAIATGNVVILGSAEATRQKAVFTAQAAAADAVATAQTLRLAQATEALAVTKVADVRATQAQLVAERNLEVVRLKAQISETGRIMSLRRLAELRLNEVAMAKVVAREEAALAAARTASASAQAAATASATAAAGAQAGVAAATAKAAGSTSLFGQAIGFLRTQLIALWAIVRANPITIIVTAFTAAVAALTVFRNQIKLGIDDITTLGDFFKAAGEKIVAMFQTIGKWAADILGPVGKMISEWWNAIDISISGVLTYAARAADAWVGMWRAAIFGILEFFKQFGPAVSDLVVRALNALLVKIGQFVNKAGEILNGLTEWAGLGKLVSQVDFTLDNANEGAAKNFGKDIAQAMSDGFNTSTYFQDAVKSTIDRAQKIAQDRTLQPVQITASKLGGEPKAKEEDPSKKLIKQLHDLKGRYDSVAAAQIEFSDGVKILDEGLKFHLITETEYYDILNKMGMALNDQLRPMEALDRQYQMQLNWLKLTTDEMQVQQDLYNMKMDLQQHGISLTDTEIEQWKVRLTQMQTETRLASERNKLLDDTVGKRRSELERLDQIKKLSQDPTSGFTENDKITELNSGGMFAGLFEGTSDLVKAQVDQFKWMYEQIDKLKKDGVISTEAAAMAESQIWAQEQKARFSMADKFLGNLAALQNSKNKEMARIGKAAAIAQATIATYTSAVEAYKSLAGIPYVGPALGAAAAAAAIAAGLANVQAIKQQNAGFMAGGYTGGISDRDVMGPVHGREFVMNAPATRRLGPDNLDALQKGTAQIVPKSDNVSGSNRPLKVSIENYGTSKQFEVQTLSPDEVRIIARDEAKQQVDLHAPRAVARELSNPNSTVSRSMAQNTSAQRRR